MREGQSVTVHPVMGAQNPAAAARIDAVHGVAGNRLKYLREQRLQIRKRSRNAGLAFNTSCSRSMAIREALPGTCTT
jgi:hypothetical protein